MFIICCCSIESKMHGSVKISINCYYPFFAKNDYDFPQFSIKTSEVLEPLGILFRRHFLQLWCIKKCNYVSVPFLLSLHACLSMFVFVCVCVCVCACVRACLRV